MEETLDIVGCLEREGYCCIETCCVLKSALRDATNAFLATLHADRFRAVARRNAGDRCWGGLRRGNDYQRDIRRHQGRGGDSQPAPPHPGSSGRSELPCQAQRGSDDPPRAGAGIDDPQGRLRLLFVHEIRTYVPEDICFGMRYSDAL